jgi:carboxypeptidase C (cathepsin A)
MIRRFAAASVFLGVVAVSAPLAAQRSSQQPQQTTPPAQQQATTTAQSTGSKQKVETAGPAEEKISQTSHSLRLDGREIKYTATAGTLPIRLDDGKVAARMFFAAYTRDGEDPKTRPIAFLYNGGPGAATIWLHMGSFAPRRVQMADEGFQPAPPYRLVDNESSLIDVADLVFVDAIDTGFSRVVGDTDNKQFHGVKGDLRAFGEFINEYLKEYNRFPSPKYLIGESYGTIRSAGLAQELQTRHGIELNGIVLVSSLLTYQTLSPSPENDVAYAAHLETYTATAWYHKKLAADLGDLKKAVDASREFAFGEYLTALAKGNRMSQAERHAIAQKMARLTGLSADYVERANLRIDPGRFRKELLRDRRLVVGRLDSRFTSIEGDAAGEDDEFDLSNTALQGPYTALFQDYVRNELKWESDLHYPTSGNVRPWSWDEFQNRYMDMTDPLRSAMSHNPYLKIFVAQGYYDMATVMGGMEYNFAHLGYDKTFTDRVSFGYYEAGHMIYIRPSAHKALKQDVAKFIDGTRNAQRPATTSQP